MRAMRFFCGWMVTLMMVVACACACAEGMIVGDGSELNGGIPLYEVDDDGNTYVGDVTDTGGTSSGEVLPPVTDDEEEEEIDPNAPKAWEYEVTPLTATLNGSTVTLVTLGLRQSVVNAGGRKETVATADLTWETTAEDGQRLAIVYAPRSGSASVRKRASTSATVLEKAVTGQIVPVLEVGKRFTKVNYNGCIGYIINSALEYSAPVTTAATATIAYNGNTKSRNTVNVRMEASSKSRIVGEYPCGTSVDVLSQEEQWSQIEVNGQRCWILSEYLADMVGTITTDAPAETAEPTDTASPEAEAGPDATDTPEQTPDAAATDAPATDIPETTDAPTDTPAATDAADTEAPRATETTSDEPAETPDATHAPNSAEEDEAAPASGRGSGV